MNKKGFTLLEILIIVVVLAVIFLFSIPIVTMIIDNSRFGAFENSVYSAIDSVEIYIANHDFTAIPPEGLEISVLDKSILQNNNFDEGLFVREDKQVRMIYIKQGIYCAKGTKDKLVTTSKGCAALDETEPTKANIFYKTSDEDSLYLVVGGYDPDSNIIKYEISVDGKNYYSNKDEAYNVFKIDLDDTKEHTFKTRVTNEAGLTLESSEKKFKKQKENNVILYELNNKENVQTNKNITFNKKKDVKYEYSLDLENWNSYDDNIYVSENKLVYLKINDNNKIVYNTLNISNIDSRINGAYPEIYENMIPVIFDGNNYIVANKNTAYWNYDEKEWATVVMVRRNKDYYDDYSKPRLYYLSSEAVGSIVYPKDILAFYVWIPRYKYKLWNVNGNNNEMSNIEIEFESSEVETSNGSVNGKWLTHPAFLYNNQNGFWISKYEMSVSTESNCYLIPNSTNCNKEDYDLYSLDNRIPIMNLSISTASKLSENLNKQFNSYGLSDKTLPHLLTNLEWGAVAYLNSSKYGDISKNVMNMDKTGEFVAGNYNNDTGLNEADNSGFNDSNWPKIIDIYKSISSKGYLKGDATLETDEWNQNVNTFVNGEYPFFVRGINSIYDYSNSTGSPNSDITFRTAIIKGIE